MYINILNIYKYINVNINILNIYLCIEREREEEGREGGEERAREDVFSLYL
jgi:hypothetical protein